MKTVLWKLAPLLLLAGCSSPAGSLHPLIPAEQAVVVPGLEGTWGEEETDAENQDGGIWTFKLLENREYELTVQDAEHETSYVFTIRLARLDGSWFVDAVLRKATIKGEELDASGMWIPVHLFGRIEVEEDQFRARLLDLDWLKKALQEGRTTVRHEMLDNDPLLTAPTAELQEFAIRYAWDQEAFSHECTLWRRRPPE